MLSQLRFTQRKKETADNYVLKTQQGSFAVRPDSASQKKLLLFRQAPIVVPVRQAATLRVIPGNTEA